MFSSINNNNNKFGHRNNNKFVLQICVLQDHKFNKTTTNGNGI